MAMSYPRRRVVVTGLGLVSPLGVGVAHAWRNLLSGGCGVVALEDPKFSSLPSRVAALVPRTDGEDGSFQDFPPSETRIMSLSSRFALVAAKEALDDARWHPEGGTAERTGTVFIDVPSTAISPYTVTLCGACSTARTSAMNSKLCQDSHTVYEYCPRCSRSGRWDGYGGSGLRGRVSQVG